MTWHADRSELDAYGAGEVHGARAHSIEQHLDSCDQCRRHLASGYDRQRMNMVWAEVVDELDRPRQPWLERVLLACGVSEPTARLLAVTPALRSSWLLGVALTLVFCVVTAEALGSGAPVLFLAITPLVPVAAVAVAFGRRFDPTAELTQSSPVSSFRLLLVRAVSVLLATIPLALGAELALDAPGIGGARWLLPSLAMVSATLALSTRVDAAVVAAVIGGCWVAVLVLAVVPAGTADAGAAVADLIVFSAVGQVLSAALVVVGVLWVFRERDAIELRRFV